MPNKYVDEVTLTIDSVDIERLNQFNIMGFTLISHLNWIKHNIDEIANRCSQTIRPITRLKYIIQTRIKNSLYNIASH